MKALDVISGDHAGGGEGVDVGGVVTDPERLTALVLLGIRDEEKFPLVFYRENCADMALGVDDIDDAYIRALESLRQSVTEKELSQFLDIVRGSETTFIVAEPRSFAAALAFRHMLAEKRQPSFLAAHDAFDAEDILALTRPTDAIVEIDISSMRIDARKVTIGIPLEALHLHPAICLHWSAVRTAA